MYGSEKPLGEVTSQAEAEDRESYVHSSYASGRQLSDIRMLTAVSSEDPEHLHMSALLGNNAFQKKGTIVDWLRMQANKYTGGRGGLYKQGGKIVWLHKGYQHCQKRLARGEINRLFE